MLCSMMQARLPGNIESVYLANPSVSPEEILHAIASELHIAPPRDAGHLEVMQVLNRHLLERHAAGKQVVMFVEESQSMPIATLEEIRLLSNLETAHSKLLQIVLFGQPELEDNLRQPHIRQLRERITHSFRLSPLKPDEIRDYLNFRLRAAGYRGPDLFSPQVVTAIARSSNGLTRRVNLIADKAMLAAFAENTHTIRLKHIKAAVRDSEFGQYESRQPRPKFALALLLCALGVAIGIALYALFEAYPRDPAPTSEPPAAAVPASPPADPAPGAPAAQTTSATPANEPKPAEQAAATVPAATPTTPATTAQEPAQPVAKNPELPAKTPIITTDKQVAGANSQPSPSAQNDVELRLAATKDWLAQGDKNAFSIQVMGVDNPSQLKHHLNVLRKYVEINEIFVYRTIAKQKPSLTVLYGSFDDRRAALEALAKLPAALKAYKPVLRTKQGIRAEIAQHQSS
jgi:type II secretory pathway predicted ATPase ExeA/septal ring-binding cell division protein DamX